MRTAFLAILLFIAVPASAHTPYLIEQKSLHDITSIENPEYSRAFYGHLNDFPNTFEIRSTKPFHLSVQVMVPDTDFAANVVSGIIIKETGRGGRVEEVTRLSAKDAEWNTFHEPWGNDTYRVGGTFEKDVEPGVYRIEVSTPDNREPYVLVVGTVEGADDIGYFETIGRLMEVKAFFGKPKIRVIESPLVYVPLGVLGLIGLALYRYRKRNSNT